MAPIAQAVGETVAIIAVCAVGIFVAYAIITALDAIASYFWDDND